jgi:hypothetical protein
VPTSFWFLAWDPRMEATCASVMSVGFQRTTRLYIPEDITLRSLKPYIEGQIHTVPLHSLYIESLHFSLPWGSSSKPSGVRLVSLLRGFRVSPPLQSVDVACSYGILRTMMPMILGCRPYLFSPHFPRVCRSDRLGWEG